MTVASVVPDGAAPDEVRAAWSRVDAGRAAITTGATTHAVVLSGDPAVALKHYARSNEVGVLVLGTRGAGQSTSNLGRVASAFARNSGMVVLYVEDDAARAESA